MKNLHDKFKSRGVASLKDEELLALLLELSVDNHDHKALANKLISSCGSLSQLTQTELPKLRMLEGIGLKGAESLLLASELGRRVASESGVGVDSINTDSDVERLMRPLMGSMQHEECWAIYLTSSNRIIEHQRISQGGVQATVVDHRLIIKRALELLATQIILVHNHPSGLAEPSSADKTLTQKVQDAAQLFDIRLLDHIIISRESSYSFRRHNLL
jgi:DNA repair protein RadC